jgi:hypothetical protein
MGKLPLSTALLSATVAVALWYLATMLEGNRPWAITQTTVEPPSPFGRQAGDTPVLGGGAALDCQQSERKLQTLVESARYCVSDDDCTIFDYGYPIQCLTSVANASITALRLEYREYEQSCRYRVYYDCPSEPLERHAVCRSKRCEVELRAFDYLKDETLQHIGADQEAHDN